MSRNRFSGIRPLFGPSGHSESYAAEGLTSTADMPRWISARGLDIFEYSFGRGVLPRPLRRSAKNATSTASR